MKTLIKYLASIGLLSLAILILFDLFVMNIYVRHDQNRYLVNVEKQGRERALQLLNAEGFKGLVYDTLYTNSQPPDIVIDQFPNPNTKVKSGRTVRLTITQPEKLVKVPDLINQSLRSAELILRQTGLKIDTIYTEFNDQPKGTVVWQSPKGGDLLPKGQGLHLTLSEGSPPNSFMVPDLVGLSKDMAEQKLELAGLKLGKVYHQQDEDLLPYSVIEQSIQAGTVLERPQRIDITISVIEMQDIYNLMMKD